jgi:anti-sigma factor RsiW
MTCDKALLTQAYVDGELDPGAALEIESHLAGCAECRALVVATGELSHSLRAVPRHRAAPPALESRILRALDEIDGRPAVAEGWARGLRRFVAGRRQWFSGAASGLAFAGVIALAVLVIQPSDDSDHVVDELAGAHVRSLMAQHLLDIGSSDRKTVSPWFEGRVDVAPPVADLSAQGYELLGGRAEFIDGKRVAAIVYSHGAHYINLFIWSDYEADTLPSTADRNGYHLVMWRAHGLEFCVVSDDKADDLQGMAKLVMAQADAPIN